MDRDIERLDGQWKGETDLGLVYVQLDEAVTEAIRLTGPLYEQEGKSIVVPDIEDTISINGHDGAVIFALHPDGTYEVPDPSRVEEAAATFWRAVIEMGQLLGYKQKPVTGQLEIDPWDGS